MLFFSDRIEKFIPPKKGRKHVLRMITEILNYESKPRKTDLKMALDYLGNVAKRRSVVFILSDFFADNYKNELTVASKRHQIIPLVISDRRERELPDVGLLSLIDAETGKRILVDTSSPRLQRQFKERATRLTKERKQLFSQIGIDSIEIDSGGDWVMPVVAYFRTRAKKGAH